MANEKIEAVELTKTSIQAALRKELQLQESFTCGRIQEGIDHCVWAIGSELILRALPVAIINIEWLQRDVLLRKLVQNHSSIPWIFAEHLTCIRIDDWICNIDRRVPGISLEMTEVPPTEEIEDALARFLRELHAIPLETAINIGIPHRKALGDVHKDVEMATRAWTDLRDVGYVDDPDGQMSRALQTQASRFWEPQMFLHGTNDTRDGDRNKEVKAAQPPATQVLLHADLKGEHLFVDQESGKLTGVIDWGDASIGDASVDVAGMIIAIGRCTAMRIVEKAGISTALRERGTLMAMCQIVVELRNNICGDDDSPEGLLRKQFRHCFAGLEVEKCLVGSSGKRDR